MAFHQNVFDSLSEKDGKIYLDGERMILTSSSVFGTLRKDLMENIGENRVKGFLIRYGWNLGANDAKKVLKKNFSSIEEILKQGPILHMMKGYTKVKTSSLDIKYNSDGTVDGVHVEGAWTDSYEAEEHLRQFGIAEDSVCHTLIGYASGYYSEICQHTVLFKEVSCKGTGDRSCYYIGKTLSNWGEEIEKEVEYYKNATIVKELESTYEKLLEERNNLSKTFAVHKRVTEELTSGNDLQSIADVVFEETEIPITIQDLKFQLLAFAGLPPERYEELELDFKSKFEQEFNNHGYFSITKRVSSPSHHRIITPIILEKKRVGYCSFIYGNQDKEAFEVDQMILERTATVCSLYMLNEKNAFEATERMKGHFLEQILNGDLLSKKEILKRGSYVNINLERPYYIAVLKYNNKYESSKNELLFHEELMEAVLQYFKKRTNILIGQRSGNIILLIQIDSLDKDVAPLCKHLMHSLEDNFPGRTFKAGISTLAQQIQQASEHYDEAVTSLQMATSSNSLIQFEDLGVVGIMIHSKNKESVKQKAKQLLGTLYEDKVNHADFIKTLYVFLSNGGNLEKSMEELALSMSGLRYRIRKLEKMLGQDLRDPASGYQLLLTLQVLISEGEIKIE
ncbi:XylR N-terminal domain-containing protein [Alteribacillus bidgolensis]|uniref:PucR C-terminal helix-turn-helix domain-containing protein n=1 Tax=Alteribacillus bidgolensis TaxID=930129 RepID=A0A1G8QTL4_9BACI|nr:XylR N-terminal domain-containing protein [Alteribacillus bidgolensis]SDJ07953.1 PucR C-terminal helix-turn-helix domain-containing protein [Alteribacillus bidgolensis]